MSEKPVKAVRHRSRNTATIIKAAKDAGATSVTFPDGTVVSLVPLAPSAESANPWDAEMSAAK